VTGPVRRVHPERNLPRDIVVQGAQGPSTDQVPEDLSLVIETPEGPVVLTGCGHAGIVNTLEAALSVVGQDRIRAVVGGLHLFEADETALAWTGEQFRRLRVAQVLGTHCTGSEAVFQLRAAAGLDRSACAVGAVGASYDSTKGLDPGTLAR
jgi:7,8-dihydropterin-6-yl-methyl-4-(beta-D-ribofuranosyl)aminobenzene 5'-phosphate synthase